jgi:hypothetical protein
MKLPFQKKLQPTERRRTTNEGRAPIYAYYARRSQEPGAVGRQLFRPPVLTADQASRAIRYSARRFGMIAVLLAVLVGLLNALAVSADARVLPLDSGERTFLRDRTVYQQAARGLFAGSVMNRTKLTINTAAISAALERQFPELATVTIKLPLIDHRPIVYIQPATPALVLITTQGSSYIVDDRGRVLANTRDVAYNAPHLPNVKDNSGTAVSTGRQALPTGTVSFLQAVLFQLERKQLNVSTFVLPAGKSELDAYLYGQSYFIKFNLADSDTAQQQAGTFLAVRHHLQEQGTAPVQYIDVRVDGRAYYK